MKNLMKGDYIVLGLCAFVLLAAIFSSSIKSPKQVVQTTSSEAMMDADIAPVARSGSVATSSKRASEGLPSDVLVDDREKALYDADPSSMGYTAEDRDFLREHGVSPEEMRAMESVIGNPD